MLFASASLLAFVASAFADNLEPYTIPPLDVDIPAPSVNGYWNVIVTTAWAANNFNGWSVAANYSSTSLLYGSSSKCTFSHTPGGTPEDVYTCDDQFFRASYADGIVTLNQTLGLPSERIVYGNSSISLKYDDDLHHQAVGHTIVNVTAVAA